MQQFDSLMHDICSVGHIRMYLIMFPHIVMVLWRFALTNLMTGFSSIPCYPDSSCGCWNEGRFDIQQGCGEGGCVLVFSFSLWSAPHLLYIHTCAHTQVCHNILCMYNTVCTQLHTVEPLYYKPLKCGNLCNKDTILCPSVVLKCIK